jgi:hypothetical protein
MPRILDKYSVETMSIYTFYTEDHKMTTLSSKMLSLMERLAEMFPKAGYQSRLEQYINSKRPMNAADVDYWTRQYESEGQYWSRGL